MTAVFNVRFKKLLGKHSRLTKPYGLVPRGELVRDRDLPCSQRSGR